MSTSEDPTNAQTPENVLRLTSAAARPTDTPQRVDRYEIQKLLGEGTFGRVYLATDPMLRRPVAIKTPGRVELSPEFRELFLREALAAASIHHPNVCPVYDAGVEGDSPYIVMRYVEGGTLESLLRRGPQSLRNVLGIARKIALGLDAAHARGVIHRDLKPANVLFDEVAREMLIADFGLARIASRTQAAVTLSHREHGTPYYMPPEQWGSQSQAFGPITPLADVYSLGVILYQMLVGRPPFVGGPYELMAKHCTETPQPPSAVRPDLDTRLDALCLKALEKKPTDRYSSAKEFAATIAHVLRNETLIAHPSRSGEQKCRIAVPGTLYCRPVGDPSSDWGEVTATPAEVTCDPQREYLLLASGQTTDTQLAGVAKLEGLHSLTLSECYAITDDGMEHLYSLTSLNSLDLSGCDIGDEALMYLTSLTSLESLDVSGCDEITDSGLECLGGLHGLRSLSFGGCDITDAGLGHLKNLSNLRSLDMSECSGITDAGLIHLRTLSTLESLNLNGCGVTDAGVAELQQALPNCTIEASGLLWDYLSEGTPQNDLTGIRSLDLSECEEVSDAGLALLAYLPNLRSLNLSGCEVWDHDLAHLIGLHHLESLNLSGCDQITEDGLEHLASVASLRFLDLSACEIYGSLKELRRALPNCTIITDESYDELDQDALAAIVSARASNLRTLDLSARDEITDDVLALLSDLTDLEDLNLRGCAITDKGLTAVENLVSLQSLDLSHCGGIGDSSLRILAKLTRLTSVNLNGCCITSAGLEYLQGHPNLRSIALAGCNRLTNDGLKHLSTLTSLVRLGLAGCYRITDAGLASLKQLPRVKVLDLSGCSQITDAGMEHLQHLSRLRSLDIMDCYEITNVGLGYLHGLANLTSLGLGSYKFGGRGYRGGITSEGLAAIKRALPNCQING